MAVRKETKVEAKSLTELMREATPVEGFNPESIAIDIDGKKYLEVANRLKWFNLAYKNGRIETFIQTLTSNLAVFGCKVWKDKADEQPDATRYGSASVSTNPYTTLPPDSYITTAETKAVGRALDAIGLNIGDDPLDSVEVIIADSPRKIAEQAEPIAEAQEPAKKKGKKAETPQPQSADFVEIPKDIDESLEEIPFEPVKEEPKSEPQAEVEAEAETPEPAAETPKPVANDGKPTKEEYEAACAFVFPTGKYVGQTLGLAAATTDNHCIKFFAGENFKGKGEAAESIRKAARVYAAYNGIIPN